MDILKEIGLTERESKVYLALLELGSVTTGSVIKKSGVPNSKIYEVLERLQSKGLISWIVKGKIKYFQASEPKKILALFKDKERTIQEMLPELEAKRKISGERKSVEIFEGIKAIRGLFLGFLIDVKKGENFYGFSTGETSTNKEIEDFYEWWGTLKINSGLKDHLLISRKNKEIFEKSLSQEATKALRGILRFNDISFPGDTAIFRDKVVLLNWEETPSATLIVNKNLAEQYTNFFLGLWKISKI